MYINDLPEYLESTSVSLDADDTALYCNSESYLDIILTLRIELETVHQWLLLNKLTLNVKKTKFMIYGSRQKLRQVNELLLHINGEEIERVPVFKYLGMMLDSELNFEAHISYIYRKACGKLTLLRKTRVCMNKQIACQLYKSLILPQLEYGDVVYMTASKTSLNDLQKVQNICCRIILLANRRTHIADMHKQLQLIPLSDRRELHLSQTCFKAIHNVPVNSLNKYFINVEVDQRRTTRRCNKMNMKVPAVKSVKARLGISFRGPHHWNNLSNELKIQENIVASELCYTRTLNCYGIIIQRSH